MKTTRPTGNPDSNKASERKKPGPKTNPAVSQIQKRLQVSKRRAQQLAREAETADGAAKVLIELKIARQRQIVEKGEIELAKLRTNTEETVPVSHLKAGVICFLRAASVGMRMQAERLCMDVSADWAAHARRFEQFANGGYYSALGGLLYLGDHKLVQAVREVIEDGDFCYPRGNETETNARHTARVVAAHTLAAHAEGPDGTPAQIEAVKALGVAFGFLSTEEAK